MNKHSSKFILPIFIAGFTSCKHNDKNKDVRPPNFLVIMADDHSTQAMSCYGSKLIETPNIDRIANEGILFENCYVTNSISGPSRACILTGKFSHEHGFTDNSQTFNGDQVTFPKLLQQNGYETAIFGKWHLNSAPQGFDYWSVLKAQGEYYKPLFVEKDGEHEVPGYVTDVVTDKCIDYLKNRDKSKPFALLCYQKAPHRNWMPAIKHLQQFKNRVFPEPETLLDDYENRGRAAKEQQMSLENDLWIEEDLKILSPEELSKPIANIKTKDANKTDVKSANDRKTGIERYRNAFSRLTKDEQKQWNDIYAQRIADYKSKTRTKDELIRWKYQQYMKDYCATIASVDENVGRLLDYLDKIGELDNTIIVYTSDQGFFLGEHGWFDKRFMYEESLRMPLIIRFPKEIKSNSRTKAMTMNIDFAPTFLDYAGVEIPKEIQGKSLRQIMANNGNCTDDWRKEVYYHYYEYPSWHSVKRHYGIRTQRYKLIHFYNDIDEWELYDLAVDPKELKNRINDPAYKNVKIDLMERLKKQQIIYKDNDPMEKKHEFFKSAKIL